MLLAAPQVTTVLHYQRRRGYRLSEPTPKSDCRPIRPWSSPASSPTSTSALQLMSGRPALAWCHNMVSAELTRCTVTWICSAAPLSLSRILLPDLALDVFAVIAK